MVYGGYSYLEYGYEPQKDDFVVMLWLNGKVNIEKAAEAVAAESSVGTWTKLSTVRKRRFEKLKARVFRIDKVSETSGYVWIAYPFEHFDWKNPLQFMASVLGNIFGMREVIELYVPDISFPLKWQKYFKGPKFGMEGIRKMIGTTKSRRPHLGTIVKPKVGLNPREFAQVAYEAYSGGLDFVKDDENLVDQNFCRWKDRFDEMMKVIDKVEKETGRKVLYSPNITDYIDRMVERIDYVKEHGWRMVMLDVYILGIPAIVEVKKLLDKYGIAIHAHRAGYAVYERGGFGVSFHVFTKLYRLLGVDELHVGAAVGKMEGGILHIKRLRDIALEKNLSDAPEIGALKQKFASHIKPIFPVASGGLDPTKVPAVVELFGKDVIIQAGGGVHGHPRGTYYGAKAMRQALEATLKKKKLKDYAKSHPELREAIKLWGDGEAILKDVKEKLRIDRSILQRVTRHGLNYMRLAWQL